METAASFEARFAPWSYPAILGGTMETSASYEARSAPSPYPTFVRSGGIFAILCHYAMLRSCWRSAVSTSTTQRSGAGCSITALSWSSDCEGISSRQTSLGEWTKPTSREGSLVLLVPGHRFQGSHHRFPAVSVARRRCCQAPVSQGAQRSIPSPTSSDQHRPGTDLQLRDPDTKKEGTLRNRCRHRPVQYLNNILEQDHRAIKRRVNAKQGFREFQAARRTIQGYEAIHMIRKGQVRWWQEMIFFDRFSSSTTFSSWQPERMRVLHAIICLRLKVATLPPRRKGEEL